MTDVKAEIERMGFDADMAQHLADIVTITRERAIEECAAVCEGGEWTRYATNHSPTKACALAIRDLKSPPVSRPPQNSEAK